METVAAGSNAIIIAPTAGGKTEAAMLPVVDGLLRERIAPVGALYLSPLRALLNNQEERMQVLLGLGGMSAFKWHGDVDALRKRRFTEAPEHLLMITPESLEVMLATPRYAKHELFGGLRYVVVDEIHAFAGDDRGDHLIALLERLREYSGHDFQRIGLSATVSNPHRLLEWLQGSSEREGRVVRPEGERTGRVIEIHPLGELEDPAGLAARLVRGRKALFFAESRGKTEKLKQGLEERGVKAFVHHSSVSRDIREETERAFRDAEQCCIVCTSSLELGLDVGNLDLVLQLDAPSTVSSFLQRLGRTGRRHGTKGHMAFLTDCEWSFLQAVALVRLAAKGQVEPINPSERAVHIFLHQVLARVLQHGGVGRHRLVDGVGAPFCFRDLGRDERGALIDHLVATDVLSQADSLLTFGRRGEKEFGAANFLELYSVFETPRELRVRTMRNEDIGAVDAWFAQGVKDGEFVFLLGGAAWSMVSCDWDKGVMYVRPAERGKVPTWSGMPRLLSRAIAEDMRELLVSRDAVAFLTPTAQAVLDDMRSRWTDMLSAARVVIQRRGDSVFLHTFAGGRINHVLAQVTRRLHGVSPGMSNFFVRMPVPSNGEFARPFVEVLEFCAATGAFTAEVVADLVRSLPRARLSKFQPYLPQQLEHRFIADRIFDLPGAQEMATSRMEVQVVGG